jgi:hypothetical protein
MTELLDDFDKLSPPQQRAIQSLMKAMTTDPNASVTFIIRDVINTCMSKAELMRYDRFTNYDLALACDKYSRMKQAQRNDVIQKLPD